MFIKKIFVFLLILSTTIKSENFDFTCIIFGATGDLTSRDLIPSLYRLYEQKKIKKFALIGAALPESSVSEILQRAKQFIKKYDEATFKEFESKVYYVQLDITKESEYKKLSKMVTEVEKELQLSGNRLVYCATSCTFFEAITKNLIENNIIKKNNNGPWNRIIYEKPFGFDLDSAVKMKNYINSVLDKDQIVYMDHFLYTQAINHIYSFRFMNPIFKNIWNNDHIESIQILFNETLSVGARGKMYDMIGALLDVVQNHMFQMLAVTAMNEPQSINSTDIKFQRNLLLQKTKLVDGFLGQYIGYKQEADVPTDSKTETFAYLKFAIDMPCWKDVPFYLVTGKCLDKTEICIRVIFKSDKSGKNNILNIWLAPDPSYELKLNVHKVDMPQQENGIDLTYKYNKVDTYSTETYKVILEEVIKGNNTITVDFEEIETAWKLIDQIKNANLPMHYYSKYTSGPEASKLI